MTTWTPASTAVQTFTLTAVALVKSTSTSVGVDASASATVANTDPVQFLPVTWTKDCPAVERETPEVNTKSSVRPIASTIGCAAQPVIPAKQTLITVLTLRTGTASKYPPPPQTRGRSRCATRMGRVNAKLPDAYRLISTVPAVSDHLKLRERAGLSTMTRRQAEAGLRGSWTACHVIHEPSGETVAMGRVIGDGGCFFQAVDMAVLPEHQRRGIGDTVLAHLLDRIRGAAPGAYVSLLADPPGRRLYAKHGFRETAPSSVGMALRLG